MDFIQFAVLYPTLLGKYFASKSSSAFLGGMAMKLVGSCSLQG